MCLLITTLIIWFKQFNKLHTKSFVSYNSYKNIFYAYKPIRTGTSGKKLHRLGYYIILPSIKIPVLLITYSKSECLIGLNNFINIISKT